MSTGNWMIDGDDGLDPRSPNYKGSDDNYCDICGCWMSTDDEMCDDCWENEVKLKDERLLSNNIQ